MMDAHRMWKRRRRPWYAWDFADGLRNYKGATGSGRWNLGTARVLLYVRSVPPASLTIPLAHEGIDGSGKGFRLMAGQAAGSLSWLVGGSGGYVETSRYTIVAGDVGKLLLAHVTVEAGVQARFFVAGAEVGSPTAAVTITDPGVNGRLVIGQHPLGFVDNTLSVCALSLSPTVMTPTEIADDAAVVMSRRVGLLLPLLPGEDQRHVADDIAGGSLWRDRLGTYDLTETGDVKVAQVT